MENCTRDFLNALKNPSRDCGEVPFYWWTGERLNKKRLTQQLETLAAAGVAGVQINYAHMNKGGEFDLRYGSHGRTIPGDPAVFSEEWWEFFRHAAGECERLGMGIGVGDYTIAWIGNGYFTDKIAAVDEMRASELSCEEIIFSDDYYLPENTLCVVDCAGENAQSPVVLYEDGGNRVPVPSPCKAYLVTLEKKEYSINPMHPGTGKMLVDIYFGEFERKCPELKKGVLNYFFQDELSFGCDVSRIWDDGLRNGVKEKYGFDPLPFIPHLFFDLGDITPKIRLNVNDIKTGLMEEGYFKPVYSFHASRGMIYGCDQSSRGRDPAEFSDYFRTVRWFTAPGNDTPGRAADLIKVKVNSSIAHLYRRPRTWLEGYHSSGWGTTLDSITSPTGDNFIFGANLLNLHGLYYSTDGGFFEWAPPDFHFRMPYWDDEKEWLKKYARLSGLLTTGTHRCDAAVFYPTASVIGGNNGEKAVEGTFSAADYLFSHGLDFDFVDYDSLKRAECRDGRLAVAGEEYKVLIFAFNDVLPFGALSVIKSFLECGGSVIFVGFAPSVSDRQGANDAVFLAGIEDILTYGNCCIAANNEAMLGFSDRKITRLFQPDSFGSGRIYSMCRVNGKDRLFYIRHASKYCVCRFEAEGSAYLLNISDGSVKLLSGTLCLDGVTIIKLPPELPQDILILFTSSDVPFDGTVNTSSLIIDEPEKIIPLNDGWRFELLPTLDNSWGDFYKPAGGVIGLQARFFDCARVSAEGEIPKKYTYTDLPFAHTMGIRRIVCPGVSAELCAAIAGSVETDTDAVLFRDRKYQVEAPVISDRWGAVVQDADSHNFAQGYHGLKGRVYDDNFIFTDDSVFICEISSDKPQEALLYLSGQMPDCVYLGGKKLTDHSAPVLIPEGRTTVVAAYTVNGDGGVFRNRGTEKTAGIHFVAGKNKEPLYELAKCDFMNPSFMRYGDGGLYVYSFRTAPGFGVMRCPVAGELLSAYNDGKPMSVLPAGTGDFGTNVYEVRAANVCSGISEVRLYVRAEKGLGYTGALPCPVDLFCTKGIVSTGDLSKTRSALRNYSGKMIYSRETDIGEKKNVGRYILFAEDVGATLKIEVNGVTAAVLTDSPFRADITSFLTDGINSLRLTVSNTLSNHYSTIPSRYSNYPEDAKSGLIGEVNITVY